MLCSKCGYIISDNDTICPACGELIPTLPKDKMRGVEDIRQGKKARDAILQNDKLTLKARKQERTRRGASRPESRSDNTDTVKNGRRISTQNEASLNVCVDYHDAEGHTSYERGYRAVYSDRVLNSERAKKYAEAHRNSKIINKRMINWIKAGVIIAAGVIIIAIGVYIFINHTDEGQKLLVRFGRDANTMAYWAVGEEAMDQGDIEGAIAYFEKAKAKDEADGVIDVDGLLLLANAYEASGRINDAASLYEHIYTETPSRPEAYHNHIRILLSSGNMDDQSKAADLLKTAFDKTGDATFKKQRDELVPPPPEVDLTAGYYSEKKNIAVTSKFYDVYYTFDENAILPDDGKLLKKGERILLEEGIHPLRAVAVNGKLVSDELKGTYKIIMPSPQTPRSSLAPNTYNKRQRVWLKPGLDNVNDNDIVIYYTIDGSIPDADSPVFTGEPFWLPGGRVTLKAVAVNRFNKVSNMLEVLYKIQNVAEPITSYTTDDAVRGVTLYQTNMTDFIKTYGEPTNEEKTELEGIKTECRKLTYSWGYAVMTKAPAGWVLAELYFQSGSPFSGPRNTGIGDSMSNVVNSFRDMGQIESPSGNRGLYENTNGGSGKIFLEKDGSHIIRYICMTSDNHYWQLEYITNTGGIVKAIDLRYLPNK